MTNGLLGRGAQSSLAYHFKKDRFPTHRHPLNRSFLKRSRRERSADFGKRPNHHSPNLTKTNTMKCAACGKCAVAAWAQGVFYIVYIIAYGKKEE